jgi:molecular chaperone HscA
MLLKINNIEDKTLTNEEEIAIGIDLGTSNSVCAFYNININSENKIEVVPFLFNNNIKSKLVPSVVQYTNNNVLVGLNIQADQINTFRSIKRFMGKALSDIEGVNINLAVDKNNSANQIVFLLGQEQTTSAVEISAEILNFIKVNAQSYIGKKITKAVITVPAYFNENQRLATKKAASLAGLEVLRLINEPTAAALAYGLDEKITGKFIIYDLGGGTFDVSILNLQKGIFKVIATGGDTELGGDDIDEAILQDILKLNQINNSLNIEQKQHLLLQAKNIKEQLSEKESISINFTLDNKQYSYTLSLQNFNNIIKLLINKTFKIMQNVLDDAKIVDLKAIDGVILVGGSTRLLYLQAEIENFFKQKPLCSINPDEVVAIGAGHQAAILSGLKQDSLLLDVTPLSLGIEVNGGIVEKIIHRNSLIPITKTQEFTTHKDGQTAILIHILQGERELVKDLQSLGKISLKGIPPLVAGLPRVAVTFKLDMDGLLTVEAKELISGINQQIEIKPHIDLSLMQMRSMIEESLEYGKDDIKKRLLIESTNNAKSLTDSLANAILIDADLLNDSEKIIITALIKDIYTAIEKEDREAIENKSKELITASKEFTERRINRDLSKSLKGSKIKDF